MSDKIAFVREFFDLIGTAIAKKDPALIGHMIGLLSPDITYQNKPMRVVKGMADFMKWFQEYGDCNHMKFTVLQIAQDGDWVLAERREEWTVNGVTTEMDVMGKFLVRDGKIHAWLDYFPYIAHWEAAKQMPEGFFKRWEDPVSVVKK